MPPHSDYLSHPKSSKALEVNKVSRTKTHNKQVLRTVANTEHLLNLNTSYLCSKEVVCEIVFVVFTGGKNLVCVCVGSPCFDFAPHIPRLS